MTDRQYAPKAKLEAHAAARPGVEEHPGYFDDAGNFVRGPFYSAKLGAAHVSMVGSDGYDQSTGYYQTREQALAGAKLCKAKAQEWLDEGNYAEAKA
jgi:hypothetical protein